MPNNIVVSFAEKTGKSEKEVEKLWDTAKTQAKEQGKEEDDKDFYPYVTGILKKMLKLEDKERIKSYLEVINNKENI